MSSSRERHHKRDANHGEISDAFRAMGCLVKDTSHIGSGFPDIVVERRRDGRVWLVEIKNGRLAASDRHLTAPEKLFAALGFKSYRLVLDIHDVAAVVREP